MRTITAAASFDIHSDTNDLVLGKASNDVTQEEIPPDFARTEVSN